LFKQVNSDLELLSSCYVFGCNVGLEAIFDPFRSLVFLQGNHGSGSNNKTESVEPYFVRRWAPKVIQL